MNIYYVKINNYKEALIGFDALQKHIVRKLGKSDLHLEYINNKLECRAYLVYNTLVYNTTEQNVLCYYNSTLEPSIVECITKGIEIKLPTVNKIKY